MYSTDEYIQILQAIELSGSEKDILIALLDAGDYGMTASELTLLLGHTNPVVVNGIFGRLARRVCGVGGRRPPPEHGWWHAMADFRDEQGQRGFVWVLPKSLREALLECGFETSEECQCKEAESTTEFFSEGTCHQVLVTSYERNRIARRRCIEFWGASCAVCGFDFEEIYGDIGRGFIHVHHLNPLSDIGTRYEVDPVEDMRPVCPNCHAMIHRGSAPLTIKELQLLCNGHSMSARETDNSQLT